MTEGSSTEVEQAVLGCCLLDPQAVLVVCSTLQRRDFTDPGNRDVFDAVVALRAQDQPVNFQSVLGHLKEHALERAVAALASLEFVLPDAYRVGDWCEILRTLTRRRESRQVARVFLSQLDQPGSDPDAALDTALNNLAKLRYDKEEATAKRLVPVLSEELAKDFFERQSTPRRLDEGASWGIRDLDAGTYGMNPGQLVVIAGRPGMGKSVAALKAARATAIGLDKPVLYFSLEMPVRQNLQRLIAAEAGVPLKKLMHRDMSPQELERCRYVFNTYRHSPLLMDSAIRDYEDVVSLCELHARREELGLVVVDYLQQLTTRQRFDSRQQKLGHFARGLKELSMRLNVPVLAAAQVNRESAKGHRVPELQELREAGDMEQDADIVVFIHREEMYGATPDNAGLCQYVVAKHRDGELGTVTALFKGEYVEVADFGG